MRQVLYLSLFLVFSSCAGPKVTVCVLDPVNQALQCARPDDSRFTLLLPQAENYVCLSPDDLKVLLDYAKTRCGK